MPQLQKTVKQYAYKEGEVVERLNLNNLGYVNSPCKGCTDRCVGCHSKCEKYAEFKAELERLKSIARKDEILVNYERNRAEEARERARKRRIALG